MIALWRSFLFAVYFWTMTYTIWIIPPEPVLTQLRSAIETLAKKYGGPTFTPHMTLLGDIEGDPAEITKKMEQLVAGKKVLELSLGPVSFSTTYWQDVFVRVNSTGALMQLNLDAKKMFNMKNDVFMPHISLLYGEHDATIREKAAAEVSLPPTSFIAGALVLNPNTPDPSGWVPYSVVPFGG